MVSTFACGSCAAQLTIHAVGQTTVVGCQHCGALIDATDPNFQVLERAARAQRIKPTIPLGSMGKFRAEKYKVIGFMRRQTGIYEWDEYLLFNPKHGFRWLTEYYGHWNILRPTKNKPSWGGERIAHHLGTRFKLFQTSTVKVTYVVGEFYWAVKVGAKSRCLDFVKPPEILCVEQEAKEENWARGDYLEPETVVSAFNLTETKMPTRQGIAPNQPYHSAHTVTAANSVCRLFIPLLFLIQLFFLFTAKNQQVYSQWYDFTKAKPENIVVTPKFEVTGRGNLVVKSYSELSNTWLGIGMTLVNEETGENRSLARELSYYSGRDSDGAWSEGSYYDEAVFPRVPPGTYTLTIDSDGEQDQRFHVTVQRGVVYWGNFFIALFGFLALPLVFWLFNYRFEHGRWENSDYPLANFSGDD